MKKAALLCLALAVAPVAAQTGHARPGAECSGVHVCGPNVFCSDLDYRCGGHLAICFDHDACMEGYHCSPDHYRCLPKPQEPVVMEPGPLILPGPGEEAEGFAPSAPVPQGGWGGGGNNNNNPGWGNGGNNNGGGGWGGGGGNNGGGDGGWGGGGGNNGGGNNGGGGWGGGGGGGGGNNNGNNCNNQVRNSNLNNQNNWVPTDNGYQFYVQNNAIVLERNNNNGNNRGAVQEVNLNQRNAQTITYGAWVKAQGVSGGRDNDFSVYLDIKQQNGQNKFGLTAQANTGNGGWQWVGGSYTPQGNNAAITTVRINLLLRGQHTGRALFAKPFIAEGNLSQRDINQCNPQPNF